MLTRRHLILAATAAPLAAGAQGGAYADQLSDALGAPVEPRVAHKEALAVMAQLHARADRLLQAQGLRRGSVAERLRALAARPQHLYPDDSAGRDRAVADMNKRLEALRPRLVQAFGELPMPAGEVRRMSAADEARGRAGYREPPAYYVDLKAIRTRPAWTLPSVAFHETNPGHLLQMATQRAGLGGQRYASVFGEAWATYAEQLAADLGAYRADPLAEIGFLQWMLFRVGRIVIDTGLNAHGWTREAAVARMREIQGQSIAFITMEQDVERMIRSPGGYAAQGLGALGLIRMRPADRSRWPAFHRAVLQTGPAPFFEIEDAVRAL
ncbi:DUF885 family protein [Phenylobacterium deserti]|uniref:DUF885 domain-containing protein n=1 Tax=Phenylobacterium deserti TaxID=1914756 RepID=A0A328APG5_9CAUL|nr:DUF885 family protein [Phenylobacterium deserti]RAK56893.1 hypothetical protein DJ018_02680 [Phenylobacterium deserti]